MAEHPEQSSGPTKHTPEFSDLARPEEVRAIFRENGHHLRQDFIKDFTVLEKKTALSPKVYAAAMAHFQMCVACRDEREHPEAHPQPQDLF